MAEDTTGRDLAHRSPGWLCFGIAVVALVAGQALLWVKPVWLAPPMATTLLLYLVLAWVWLPIAVICLVRTPRGARRSAVGAFVLALILGVLGCASGFNSGNVNTWLLDQDMAVCERTPLPENSERFTCTLSIIYSTQIYVLEGPREGPFYRLVEVRMVGS